MLGVGKRAKLCWGLGGMLGWGTAPSCEIGCGWLCGQVRRQPGRRSGDEGRREQMERKGRGTLLESGPSAG